MAEVKSVVCDLCGAVDADTYAIAKRPNTPFVVDLCESCAAPLEQYRERGRGSTTRQRRHRKYEKVIPAPKRGRKAP